MLKFFNKIKYAIISLIYSNKFKSHKKKNNSIILAEFNAFHVEHIGMSYLLECLISKYKGKIISHYSHVVLSYSLKRSVIQKLKSYIGESLKIGNYRIYNSLGINDFYFPKATKENTIKANKVFKYFLIRNNTREKIINFKIDNILFGDLLYDTYLKKHYDLKPTVFPEDKKFQNFSYEFILFIVIWLDFFKKNNVKAVIGSDCAYSIGVPLRIALNKNIDAFAMNSENLSRLNKKMPLQYCEFKNYRKNFNNISPDKKISGIKQAKKKLLSRLAGNFSPDYHYATKSPFKKFKKSKKNVIKNTKKIKLVVATHDFVDAPHLYGKGFFPEFYQWLLFLGEISKKTNYDWYIKTHIPYKGSKFEIYQPHERNVVKDFVSAYKNFTVIPAKTTFPEIISNRIDGILTVNGTVGAELPYYNIPVINASRNNPHINYKFNIHPKNRKDLENILLNLTKIGYLRIIPK